MTILRLVLFLLLVETKFVEANVIYKYFGSIYSFVGIVSITVCLIVMLGIACRIDIKHWKRSIDAKTQEKYPPLVLEDLMTKIEKNENEENLQTPLGVSPLMISMTKTKTAKSNPTEAEKSQSDNKHRKIIEAIYSSSHRDLPNDVKQSLSIRETAKMIKPNSRLEMIKEEHSEMSSTTTKSKENSKNRLS